MVDAMDAMLPLVTAMKLRQSALTYLIRYLLGHISLHLGYDDDLVGEIEMGIL